MPHLDHPWHIDATGRTAQTDDAGHLRDLIEQVLFTAPGERVMRPDFGSGLLGLVFEPNSSYFPRGAEAELRRLVEALPPGPGYTFELAAAVDDTVYRVGDPAKAVAYNEWLAERRQGRVADWLEQHVEVREVEVRRILVPHDASRRVVISARALP